MNLSAKYLSNKGIVFTCLVTRNPQYIATNNLRNLATWQPRNLKNLANRNLQFSNPQHAILATCNLATHNFSNWPAAPNLWPTARRPQPLAHSPQGCTTPNQHTVYVIGFTSGIKPSEFCTILVCRG